jgi:hypothetical protein
MTRRVPTDQTDWDLHMEWLRRAVHDTHVDVRLILEGLLNALESLSGPGRDPR